MLICRPGLGRNKTCQFVIYTVFICHFFLLQQVKKRVKLEGKELEEYLEKEKLKKETAKKLEQAKE